MKKIFIILCFIAVPAIAQKKLELTEGQRPLMIQTVVVADSLKKSEIFSNTLLFLANLIKDSRSAIELKDESAGIIKGKYIDDYKLAGLYQPFYNDFLFEIKDGKVRFTITNITTVETGIRVETSVLKADNTPRSMYKGFFETAEAKINAVFTSYGEKLNTKKKDF